MKIVLTDSDATHDEEKYYKQKVMLANKLTKRTPNVKNVVTNKMKDCEASASPTSANTSRKGKASKRLKKKAGEIEIVLSRILHFCHTPMLTKSRVQTTQISILLLRQAKSNP